MKKTSIIKNKIYVIYTKKDLVLVMVIKGIIKSEITVTMQESTEELLVLFLIYD